MSETIFLEKIQSYLEMMKNASYFTLKALFVLNIFKFFCHFSHVDKRLH